MSFGTAIAAGFRNYSNFTQTPGGQSVSSVFTLTSEV